MENRAKRNIFFLVITPLFLAYCLPIIIQGAENFRMINTFVSDEGTAVVVVSRMINEGSLYPRAYSLFGFFNYGAIYFYINYVILWIIKNLFSLNLVYAKIIVISLRSINVIFAILSETCP